jgi:hypothetical protein
MVIGRISYKSIEKAEPNSVDNSESDQFAGRAGNRDMMHSGTVDYAFQATAEPGAPITFTPWCERRRSSLVWRPHFFLTGVRVSRTPIVRKAARAELAGFGPWGHRSDRPAD